eukprot:1477636-Lingulodinium_polyedra.AAC.1
MPARSAHQHIPTIAHCQCCMPLGRRPSTCCTSHCPSSRTVTCGMLPVTSLMTSAPAASPKPSTAAACQ